MTFPLPPDARAPQGHAALRIAVIGAGPVGLTLALHAAVELPQARVTVIDARAADHPVEHDPRTLALSLGSLQVLKRLGVWDRVAAQSEPVRAVRVSQQQPALLTTLAAPFGAPIGATLGALSRLGPGAGQLEWLAERVRNGPGEPVVAIDAHSEGVAQLGAVISYGALVAPLQHRWLAACAAEPSRLRILFGVRAKALKTLSPPNEGVEVDADIVERHDLAVLAEGGVFADQAHRGIHHDYRQTAWVGTVTLAQPHQGVAWEHFTADGPLALLPLPPMNGSHRAALVWCVPSDDDPVAALSHEQRLTVLASRLPAKLGQVSALSPLKSFALGLNAAPSLIDGRTVRIGNAAQTLHPVAGQGLNLGLRDAMELVFALRRAPDLDAALAGLARRRAVDRWALIAATDFLARSFTWDGPGLSTLRGLGLAALQASGPLKSQLARHMMFGRR